MSETTPHLALPLMAAAQAQKHVTHNEALLLLDAAAQLGVIDRLRTVPPAAPQPGDRHIVAPGAGGEWAGHDNEIALHDGGGWRFLMPRAGWRAYVDSDTRALQFDGSGWRDILVGSASGGRATLRVVEEDLALAGAFVESSIAIPNRAICLAVASRTLETATGATAYEVGVAEETSKFGGLLSIAAGATNIGVIGPQAFYAATPLRITALGGSFTGGRVRLVLSYFVFGI
ncbi:Uncharacterised protein [Starkeya nomas]|uniref:Uncharacterized protein n=1 Tax=Starkeya nomas TaxID=2666134 RepID=A0A5S9NF17_9HYPH|nr:DUF2793 domain-containing protein [Starkeya nomas]CAA0088226.1 Uncharacterised protein [Starkeya nomas]